MGFDMRTVAIANQKGGCGKTTTSVNLSAALAEAGQRVLLVDLDPQAHATIGLGFDPERLDATIYNAIAGTGESAAKASRTLLSTIIGSGVKGLSLIPSNILLSGGELELARMQDREYVLAECLAEAEGAYDICIIDCSPSLSLLTLNALVASTDLIVPVQAHYYALEGLRQLLETVNIVCERFNPGLVSLSILLTFVEKKTALSREIERQMRDYFGGLVFETVIRRNVRLAEAPSAGEPITDYAPQSRGASDYTALAREILYGSGSDGACEPEDGGHGQSSEDEVSCDENKNDQVTAPRDSGCQILV